MKKKQLKFLQDTIAHFNSGNRGISPVTKKCSYLDGCAIGRHLDKDLCRNLDAQESPGIHEQHIFEQMPKQLQELGQDFLERVQELHDFSSHWDGNGLTADGLASVEKIKQVYNLF